MKERRGWGEKTHTTVQTIIAVLNQTRIIKYMYIYKETSPGDIRDDRCLTSDGQIVCPTKSSRGNDVHGACSDDV